MKILFIATPGIEKSSSYVPRGINPNSPILMGFPKPIFCQRFWIVVGPIMESYRPRIGKTKPVTFNNRSTVLEVLTRSLDTIVVAVWIIEVIKTLVIASMKVSFKISAEFSLFLPMSDFSESRRAPMVA